MNYDTMSLEMVRLSYVTIIR